MKLSVITVNYNNLGGLKDTAASIAGQTFRDFEWIIIDGGSKDGSTDYIKTLERKPDYCVSEADKGVYDAMNKGLMHANGEYVWFMNSGDCFHEKTTLEQVMDNHPEADIVYGDWINVYKDREEKVEAPRSINPYTLYHMNINHQAMMIRTCLLKESPYDLKYRLYSDWAKWREMYHKGATFQYVPVTTCNYEAQSGMSSTDRKGWRREKYLMMEEAPEGARQLINTILKLEDKNAKHVRMMQMFMYISTLLLLILTITVVCISL